MLDSGLESDPTTQEKPGAARDVEHDLASSQSWQDFPQRGQMVVTKTSGQGVETQCHEFPKPQTAVKYE